MDWLETLQRAGDKAAAHAKIAARKDGVPFYFRDKLGRWVKEYPDGKRSEVIQVDGGKKEVPIV